MSRWVTIPSMWVALLASMLLRRKRPPVPYGDDCVWTSARSCCQTADNTHRTAVTDA